MSLNIKSKLLWVGDDYRIKSGYGRVARELFLHLNKNYTIINYSIGCMGISSEYHVIDSNDGTPFGFIKLPLVIDTIKPNIIILLNDSKIIYGWLQSIKKSQHNCIIIPYVCTEYTGIPKYEIELYNEMTQGLLAMANFTINEFVKNGYIHKTLRLSHGYTNNILPMNKIIAKKKLGISHDTFVFFSGNKNQPRKRLDIIIRAFVHFLKNHNNEKVMLMMNCGLIDSGWNLKELYIRLCEENNIINMENHIYFCSFNINDSNKNDDELSIIYNACDVGITTSTGESFGLIPFEQSALGIPQIIPNWGGIIEAIKFGCIKIEPNDYYVYPVILQSSNGEARTVYYKDVMSAMEQYYTDNILYNNHTTEVKKNIENFDWITISNELIKFINPFITDNIESENIKCNNYNNKFTEENCFAKKCIFVCIFNQEKYVDMFYLLLESIFIYGNLDDNTNILVYTSTPFMNKIKQSHLFNDNKIKFEINDTYNNIDKACKSRLDLFNLDSIKNYNKILYLDTDILVKDNINKVFNVCDKDILYVLEEGSLDVDVTFWGKALFSNDEINNYEDKTTFTSGILLFNNCEKIKDLFLKIREDIVKRPYNFCCYDQPYIIYNAFKYNLYNNKILKSIAVNIDTNIHSNKVIHHFPIGVGLYKDKIEIMTIFLNGIKDFTINNNIYKAKQYINNYLLPIIHNCGEKLEGNIFMLHHTTDYTNVYFNKSKNISNLVLNKNIKNVMEIGFNSGFSTLLMLLTNPNVYIYCFDLGEHKYTISCYKKMKETFGDRINITLGDSTQTLQNVNDKYDLIHIDGGHSIEIANIDIINSYRLSKQGTILIMDDYDFPNLHNLWNNYIIKYNLQKLHINVYNSPHHDVKYVCVINMN